MTETVEGMDDLQRRVDAIKDTRKALGRLGLMVVALAKQKVPRKTGNLGRTIRLGNVTETEVQVLAGGVGGVGYAQAVEFGSRPHEIVPRYKSVLAWSGNTRLSGSPRSGASLIFSKRVRHPGTKPQPYIMPAAQEVIAKEGITELVIRPWNEAA